MNGGNQLYGDISISGAKNAALPLLAAGLMSTRLVTLSNVPSLADTRLMIRLLDQLGMTIEQDTGTVVIQELPEIQMHLMIWSARCDLHSGNGAITGRIWKARVSLRGCAIGSRPVDLHIRAMQQLGAVVELADGYVQPAPQMG